MEFMANGGTRGRLFPAALLAIGVLAFAPAAGAAEPYHAKRVRSFLEIRQEHVVIQQWDLSCGAATLTTLLNYQFGDGATEEEIAKSMLHHTDSELVRKRLGFSLLDLKRELGRRGYRGDGYADLKLEDLLKMVPAVVRLKGPGYDHFVIVRGTARGRIVMADPAYGNKVMRADEFLGKWRDGVAFVVSRPDGTRSPGELAVDPAEMQLVPPQAIRAAEF
jgi:predicted double-glycine peptidase